MTSAVSASQLDRRAPLPAGWEWLELWEFAPRGKKHTIVDGPFGSNLKTEHYRASGIPIISSGFVTDGVFRANKYLYVDQAKFDQERRSAVYAGDIVMAKIGARCGASAILPYDHRVGILSGNALKISIDTLRHSTEYVAAVLDWMYGRGVLEDLRSTGAQPAMSMPLLKRLTLPAPPLEEQRLIVAALGDTTSLIVALEGMIAKKVACKRGLMQELLTGKTRLPGFSEPWQSMSFEALAYPVKDRADPKRVPANTPLVELEHIESGTGRLLAPATATAAASLKTIFEPGDVLFGKLRAYLRKFWFADRGGICSTEIWALRSHPQADGPYVRYLVETERFIEVASGGYGTHMPRADWSLVWNVEFAVPRLKEQKAITSHLQVTDHELELLGTRLAKAKAIKQGMMQELLTGRTRLHGPEAVAA